MSRRSFSRDARRDNTGSESIGPAGPSCTVTAAMSSFASTSSASYAPPVATSTVTAAMSSFASTSTATFVSPNAINADFSSLSTGSQDATTFLANTGFTYTRAGTATVQTSASTIASGVAANYARIGDRATGSRGLVIEPRSIQCLATDPRDVNAMPSAGSGYTGTTLATGADGTASKGTRVELGANKYSKYVVMTHSGDNAPYTASQWMRSHDGVNIGGFYWDPNSSSAEGIDCTTSQTWGRFLSTKTTTVTGGTTYEPGSSESGMPSSAAMDFEIDFMLVNKGQYAIEAIDTASGTPGPDILSFASGSSVINSNRVRIYQKFIPKFASTKSVYYHGTGNGVAATNLFLWSANGDGSLYARLSSTLKLALHNGATTVTSNETVAWARYDVVEFWIEAGDAITAPFARYRVNAATQWTTLSWASSTTLGNISISGALTFFADDQESTAGTGTPPIWCQQIVSYNADQTWSPLYEGGGKMMLRSDTLTQSGGTVSSWTDQSGLANHLTEGTNKPAYNAAGGANSTPSVTFTAAGTTKLAKAAAVHNVSGAFTICLVFKCATFIDQGCIFQIGSTGTNGIEIACNGTGGRLIKPSGAGASMYGGDMTANTYEIWVVRYNGSNLTSLFVNNSDVSLTNSSTAFLAPSALTKMGFNDNSPVDYANALVEENHVFDHSISADSATRFYNYAHARYSI